MDEVLSGLLDAFEMECLNDFELINNSIFIKLSDGTSAKISTKIIV